MKKLILFGIGNSAEVIESKLYKKHEIVGYTDSRAKINIYKGKPFYPLDKLKTISYDYIIITIKNRITAEEIRKLLVEKYSISKEKVIPFFMYANTETYKNIMHNCQGEVQGLIFGNSHARDGFLTDYISMPFVNLAMTSQDLYANFIMLKTCLNQYRGKLEDLKYVILDLYDYNYFNFDCSMTSNFMMYISKGGVLDKHNYEKSKKCKCSFESDLNKELCLFIDKDVQEILKDLFEDCWVDPDAIISRGNEHINSLEPLPVKKFFANMVKTRFDETVQENKDIIEKFCLEIKKYNPQIKIIFTLIPRYITMEEALKPFMAEWKNEFEEFIDEICHKYNAEFLNLKSEVNIAENNFFYYNIDHLNTTGGICLTSILDLYLKKLAR